MHRLTSPKTRMFELSWFEHQLSFKTLCIPPVLLTITSIIISLQLCSMCPDLISLFWHFASLILSNTTHYERNVCNSICRKITLIIFKEWYFAFSWLDSYNWLNCRFWLVEIGNWNFSSKKCLGNYLAYSLSAKDTTFFFTQR